MPNFVHCINVKLCRLSLLHVQKEDVELRWILSSYCSSFNPDLRWLTVNQFCCCF